MKKYLFSALAVIVAAASVAFTSTEYKKTLPPCESPKVWFKYTGPAFRNTSLDPSVTLAALRNPANYTKLATPPTVVCDDVVYFCAICAEIDPNNSNRPLIIDRAEEDIYDHLAQYFSVTGVPLSDDIVEKTLATE